MRNNVKQVLGFLFILVGLSVFALPDGAEELNTPIRFLEEYGSKCCPKDSMHNYPLWKYIAAFQQNHEVKIREVYRIPYGKEGEEIYFLTLNELTTEQRIVFVKERALQVSKKADSLLKLLNNPVELIKLLPEAYPKTANDIEKYKVRTFWDQK